jgi:serine/threonine-protein kinase
MLVPSLDGASSTALVVGLALAGVHTAWTAPRLGSTAAWGAAAMLAVLAAAAAPWLAQPWVMGMPAAAVMFGQLGRSLAGRTGSPAAMQPHVGAEPAPPTAPETAMPAEARAPGGAPQTLGRYRIDGEIGRGAMGAVYLGRDPQLGRQVAIKTLALGREFAGEKLAEARRRFLREAETAGRLQHPGIVTVFDAGETGELAWIAMEYVKGVDLQQYAVPGRLLPVPQVLEVVARVADVLAYAHSQGVVHRDIKPANVMLELASGQVKVMDFGVARLDDASRTRTGIVLGTPAYMSPEQLAGRHSDGRADLYALGVTLFQLLTGRLPHEASAMAELMRQIVNDAAPDVRTLRPELPEALAGVVALALQKRPEVRYADGVQMAQDLRAVAAAMLAPPMSGPSASEGFEKTVTFSREEPRHNSAS